MAAVKRPPLSHEVAGNNEATVQGRQSQGPAELTVVGGPAPSKDSSRQGPRDDDWYEATAQGRRSQGPAGLTVVGGPAPRKDSSRQGPHVSGWYPGILQI